LEERGILNEIPTQPETNQHLAALIVNAGAVRAVTEAVQGTLGPKGLDCLLIDEFGSVIVTNDGVSILKTMDVNHPAARMIISAAEHQEEQVGDGTTTATILAGALINEGVNQVIKGVPVIKVIEGIRLGINDALEYLKDAVVTIDQSNIQIVKQIALIAGRNHPELAELIVEAAKIVGEQILHDPGYKLADQIIALESSENHLIRGTIIERVPLNKEMPRRITAARIVIIDDSLEPIKVDSEALTLEIGFKQQIQSQEDLRENIKKLARIGVTAIFTNRSIAESVEDLITDLGMIAVQQVAMKELQRLATLTGARPIKKSSLFREESDLTRIIGAATEIVVDEKYNHIKVYGSSDCQFVTVIVGAATKEVVAERERIAKDAAAAVQAALCSGVVPGGGSTEISIASRLAQNQVRGMNGYGYQCVIEALKQPMTQICSNAGFNPLEKIEEVLEYNAKDPSYSYGVNCDTGRVEDLALNGVWDPFDVKYLAIKTAGEVSEAILRINNIIKMKNH
jgi:chaperonin GroEL (HSP60 family)